MRTICITHAISGEDCDGVAGVFTSSNQDRAANITDSSISDSGFHSPEGLSRIM